MRIRTLVQLGGLSLTGVILWRGLRWLASDDPRVCALALRLFRAQERRRPPPPHPVVFTGSSSIALWRTLARDMAGLAVLNRGIAGAKFPHIVHHAEALVTRYRPRAVVVFAGTNDIAWPAPKPPEAILACFQAFVARVRAVQPTVPIIYVAITPTPARRQHWPRIQEANRLVAEAAASDPHLVVVDLTAQLLDASGRPSPDLYRRDGLHPNQAGYARWAAALRPLVSAALAGKLPARAQADRLPPEDEAGEAYPVPPALADSPDAALSLHDVTAERGWTPEGLAAREAAAGEPVWLEGDELTFVFRGAASAVCLGGGIQLDMHRLAGSDSWLLTVKHAELPRATVTYLFVVDGSPTTGGMMTVWRGPLAPPAPLPAAVLQGVVRSERLWSAALGEERGVTVYLPPGHSPGQRYPVIYAADGEAAGGLAQRIEPLILQGELPPLLIVGAHSSDLRAEEYIPRDDLTRFAAHERFFVAELAAWAEQALGATTERTGRAVFGFSNGGVFAGEMALRQPDHFGVAMPFSAGILPDTDAHPPVPTVRCYLAAGLFEAGFYTTTRAFAQQIAQAGAEVVFRPRVAGHDYAMWEEELTAAARWAFGSGRS